MNKIYLENIQIAFRSIKGNKARSFLTMLIIAFGITALVSILTATDALKGSVNSNFSRAGAQSFRVSYVERGIQLGNSARKRYPVIQYKQAEKFQKATSEFSHTTLFFYAGNNLKINFNDKEVTNVTLLGIDEQYFTVESPEIEFGRDFTKEDINGAKPYIIIGEAIAKKLFTKKKNALGSWIKVGFHKYIVAGILKQASEGRGFSVNQNAFIPTRLAKQQYNYTDRSLRIVSKSKKGVSIQQAIEMSVIELRKIRKLRPKDSDNFIISKSGALLKTVTDILDKVGGATSSIGILTLLGAIVALTNIMLVSVTERTKEIGVRKSLGASSNMILSQFLTEAVVISFLGGILGIMMGIVIGNLVAIFLKSPFVIPWFWIFSAVIICLLVGVISGIYPARRASRMQPVEALRKD
jgi:putative ABC transport system permease protein